MSHKLTCQSIQNVQLGHQKFGRGIGPYAPAPTWAQAHAHAHTPAHAHANAPPHAHANATAPHLQYCAAGSTSVIRKMTIPWRRIPFMEKPHCTSPRACTLTSQCNRTAHAHANATTLHPPPCMHMQTHTNATALHPWYCAAGSTSVISKMTIWQRWSPFMDDLVR
ncbi:hypothetical protein O181_023489 [Austropuccinia psidii MF-1]|uniref:Uncharacterized protein n=1 Tax=Austropuccinia psidii MF-1 TaxID=1389203 RepID=A0A9Q3GYQ3_9BASI|nr:hypothetical protein [Austropuccinia psidii MF-1]